MVEVLYYKSIRLIIILKSKNNKDFQSWHKEIRREHIYCDGYTTRWVSACTGMDASKLDRTISTFRIVFVLEEYLIIEIVEFRYNKEFEIY